MESSYGPARPSLASTRSKKTVTLEGSKEKISYEKLVLATGSTPKRLPIPGNDLPHVFVLRTVEDAKKIDAELGEGKTSCRGRKLFHRDGSWSSLLRNGSSKAIHVVGNSQIPLPGRSRGEDWNWTPKGTY